MGILVDFHAIYMQKYYDLKMAGLEGFKFFKTCFLGLFLT